MSNALFPTSHCALRTSHCALRTSHFAHRTAHFAPTAPKMIEPCSSLPRDERCETRRHSEKCRIRPFLGRGPILKRGSAPMEMQEVRGGLLPTSVAMPIQAFRVNLNPLNPR